MPITRKCRTRSAQPEAALSRLGAVARDKTENLGPYADQARETASQRIHQARDWTAPRLEMAAYRVEDTVAPRVADFLSSTAQRVEPRRTRRGIIAARKTRRRVPRAAVIAGVAVVGAAACYGALKLRQASQDAEWQANLNQAREQVRETREQLAAKARDAKERVAGDGGAGDGDGRGPSEAGNLNGQATT
ncbi:hypothetical protein FHX37_3989 [Haloactinospora alba]|uniref:Uncharacterized protein n=1 Tax=Haloactinospora alba TaxID=405555 RepID=A0A543N9W9_9ACTN|nr:hypothetical protein [Haloactinospora alba]TQN28632.1 hypothetical protein FHX37_3989 [Haloactinospora alba]